ncbi:MAG: molybdate ABC transporter substrate-binding protein [Reichenbachiella sp.]|uniref:molybdate ABC transporter substrate-binding protein n=3 Tax=Reichenbachiella sp. TaxID=2184521 RepID=UPI0032672D34
MYKVIAVIFLLFAFSCRNSNEAKVTVAVSANMQYAMQEIMEKFEAKYSIKVEASSSSSGILTTQIRQGAPFDIFMSANMLYPSTLYKEGLAASKPKTYAHGALILWTLKSSVDLDGGLNCLRQNEIEKIAIANSEIAPYGIAALEALNNDSLYDQLRTKFIVGESIGQVNQYIQLKAVDIGITSKSVLYSPHVTEKGKSIEIDQKLYAPIDQGIVILKHGKENNLIHAELFYDFMFSDEVRSILFNFGYNVN